MKLTAQVKLQPTKDQRAVLKKTIERCNAACNWLSDFSWRDGVFGQYALHKAAYYATRAEFPDLGAQAVVRCIAKVADSYKLDIKRKRSFKEHGAISFDERLLSWKTDKQTVSIWTVNGRETITYVCGEHQRELLKHQQGESDLLYSKGEWYLLATCDIVEPTPDDVDKFLGVDRGIVNLATDSDGAIYQGDHVEALRRWHTDRRAILQKVGTRSARRRLRKLSGRQARFQSDINHCISKKLVLNAKGTKRGVALEDLTGITKRTTVRRDQRAKRGNWAFNQLEFFIVYKANKYGVPVRFVDPAYTSQRCYACGHIERANRKSQSEFLCVACGHKANADVNAALNIAFKAAVNQPVVSGTLKVPGCKPPASAVGY